MKELLTVDFPKKAAGEKTPNGEVMTRPFHGVRYEFNLQERAQAQAA